MGGQVTHTTLQGTLRCHSLMESMYPQDAQNSLPLCFHANTKGSQIVMDKTQRNIRRIGSFCNAITFTNRPLRNYEQVRLKITKRQGCWSGALRVGFTTVNPSHLMSSWLPRFACPDLVNQRGFWARALPEEHCEEGTVLSFWLDNTGQAFYRVNECAPIFFFSGVLAGEPAWAIIDIYGLTRGVQLFDSKMVPAEYLRPEGMHDWRLSIDCSKLDHPDQLPSLSTSPNTLNSVLSRQLHDDLHFHVVHGNGLRLLTEHIAVRYYRRRDDCALAFSHRPLRCGECVFLKVSLKFPKVTPIMKTFLTYGFTSCNPAHINPKNLPDNPDVLLDRKEFWAFSCLDSPLEGGDIFGFRATAEGEVLVNHNGGRACQKISVDHSTPLWMIFELQPHIKQISILGTSCSYSQSFSQIHQSSLSTTSHPTANQIHNAAVRGLIDSSQTDPHSLNSFTAETISSSPSSESPNIMPCCAVTGDECLICCESTVDSVLYTCGHMCVCSVCGGKLREMSNPSCPMCRSPIRDIIKIYHSM